MKKAIFPLLCTLSLLAYAKVEKYYVNEIEISKTEYAAIDSTLIRSTEIRTENDTIRYILSPHIFAKIDTVSIPGIISVVKRPDAEIEAIKQLMYTYRTKAAILKVGDTIPDFTFIRYDGGDSVIYNYASTLKGNVVLINFWATWCRPCLEELRPQNLPSVVKCFKEHANFKFLPVSANHDRKELEDFFMSEMGREFSWLKTKTAWDKNGEFAKILSEGGIPLTILIDKEGIIRLNESGAFLSQEQLSRLKETISDVLQAP